MYVPAVCNGKIIHDSPKLNPSLQEGNGQEAQIHNSIMLQEQGIYSLLQAESEIQVLLHIITLIYNIYKSCDWKAIPHLFQLNDSEKKQAPGQLIYADIGNSVDTHGQHVAPISMPYPSLSLQLDDSQVKYADVKPHQSITNHDMVVDTEAGKLSSTYSVLWRPLPTLRSSMRSRTWVGVVGRCVPISSDLIAIVRVSKREIWHRHT